MDGCSRQDPAYRPATRGPRESGAPRIYEAARDGRLVGGIYKAARDGRLVGGIYKAARVYVGAARLVVE